MNTNPTPTYLPAYVNSYSYTIKVSCKSGVHQPSWLQEHVAVADAIAIAKASVLIANQLEANAPLPHAPGCGCGPCYW